MMRAIVVAGITVACVAGASNGRVTPDGSNGRIAFAMRSDLFTIRPDGAGLKRVTSGTGVDGDPSWSPDGRWLAFARTFRRVTSVYVVAASGGRPRLLARGARSPSWSPSGRQLAVVRSGVTCTRTCPWAHDLWIVAFTGEKLRLVRTGAWAGAWSPSGTQLAAIRSDGVWTINMHSGAVHHLSSVSANPGSSLDWSPDGRWLLLANDDGIVTVSAADGSTTTLVPAVRAPDAPAECPWLDPRWSPNGRWIAYEQMRCVRDGNAADLYASIPIIDGKGTWQNEIDNRYWGDNPFDIGTTDPVWSPDSRLLAFIDDETEAAGASYLAVATRDGKSYRRLAAGVSSPPAWQRLTTPP